MRLTTCLAHSSDREMEMLSLESDHYRHLPQMYHADAIRDMDIRPNVNSLDLASPPPSRQAMRNSQPLTPPITPARRPEPRFIPVLPPHDHDHPTPPTLPSPASSITDERPSSRLFLQVQQGTTLPTRYLVLTGLPSNIHTDELTQVFSRLGDLKGLFVRFQSKSGVIILSFHDLRHAVRAYRTISNQPLFGLDTPCSTAFITPEDLIMSTGESPFVNTSEGNLRVVAVPVDPNNPPPESVTLHAAIAVFGEVAALKSQRDPSTNTTTYYATFYDAREATRAVAGLNGRSVLGHILHVSSPNLDIRYTDATADHTYLASPVSNDGPVKINSIDSSRLSVGATDETDRDLGSGPPPSPVVAGVHRLHVPDSRFPSYDEMYRSTVGSSSGSRLSGTAPPRVVALDSDGDDPNTSSTNYPQTEVYSTGPALQPHHNAVEDEEAAHRKASPISGIEASSKSTSPFTPPSALSSSVAPPIGSSESYHAQRGLPSHVTETSHSANSVRYPNGQASCGDSPSTTRSRVLPPRLSLPWLAQQSANTPLHPYVPTVSPYTPSPYVEHDSSLASVHAPNSTAFYGYHGHPLPQYPQHPLPLQHAHPHHKYPPYPPSPYHYYGLGYYPPPPSTAYTTPSTTASSYSHSGGPSPISTSPEVQMRTLSKRGSLASLASAGAPSISGSSVSGGRLGGVSMDDIISGGEHATPTPAAHVPMNGNGKALLLDMVRTARHSASPIGPGPMVSTMSTPPNPNPVTNPEKNAVDIAKIEAGLDTRTTVMLKNVPNKMSSSELQRFIWDVVPKSFDFMYLRFDFSSSANVGYAFVNFIDVQDLLLFAKTKLGVKWNMYSSDKVLQMSYANFQGKEALVEKFKNSCVMEMQDEWIPKIFYTSGPNRGQREPFPTPSNVSRTRRSADQRERGILRTHHLIPYPPSSRGHGRHMRVE